MHRPASLPWLLPGDDFPPLESAWGAHDPAPGLLAGGGALDVATLVKAYSQGVFPWYSGNQPILWWSPDPRMVLPTAEFRLHRSLKKTLRSFQRQQGCELRVDHNFEHVLRACAAAPREGQDGTWIGPDMIEAYLALHAAGHAHSFETWIDGQCVGGLYVVSVGRALFGESMFARRTDASKIALAALVAFCRRHGIGLVDCQQNTAHLASLGAREWPRARFARHVAAERTQAAPEAWRFDPADWELLLAPARAQSAPAARPPHLHEA
ncbi:leucyl/phenylalanyl-tRNA--protein transferase [Xenophilus arseniciresistens]|uniref:Leucyl/phenylalanyl-tRNA--protein transferase n=1 Tax=Xenophilus arseniciresistens TaxID=1283306 RepID=A0AAE3N4R8_9BURK|nr:leucyl/phenylalanyl-tRNA--protein transferase [Xenophilus arseniciresistens]MDA7415830.1 leucyl/phenylalanyl-tRNA--protein transferase [Xenophilus arseniciresistens]